MGSLTNFSENELVDHLLGVGAYTAPTTVYLALSTADPTDDASGLAEPGYTGYARKAITFGAASGRTITQSATVNFDPCTAGSATVTHWALMDASTVGNALAYGALDVSKNIVSGNTPSVSSGEVVVEFTAGGGLSNYAAGKLLDLMFRNQAFSSPTPRAALFTTVCSDSAAGTEVTGGSYARVSVTFSAASGGVTSNSGAVTFPTPTASWGTVVAMALMDAASAGNMLAYDNTSVVDQLVGIGDTVTFPIGDIDFSMS